MHYLFKGASTIFVILFAASTSASNHQEEHSFLPEWRTFVELSYNTGGDGIEVLPLYDRSSGQFYSGVPINVTGNTTDLNRDPMIDGLEAGGVAKVSAGVEIPISKAFAVSASLGYMFDEVEGYLNDGSNGKGVINVDRWTSELITYYSFGAHRLGIGAALHVNPVFTHVEEGSGFKLETEYEFDSAVGGLIQYDYRLSQNTSLGIRYTEITYDIVALNLRHRDGSFSENMEVSCAEGCEDFIDAGSVGVHLTYRF